MQNNRFTSEDFKSREAQQAFNFDEIESCKRTAAAKSSSARDVKIALQNARKAKVRSIIGVMRGSAMLHPELKKIFDALSDSSIDAAKVAEEVDSYPIALELIAALEKGLKNSSHSTVIHTSIDRFGMAIDAAAILQAEEDQKN
jgi:hypothetical protein